MCWLPPAGLEPAATLFLLLETKSHEAQAGFKLTVQLKILLILLSLPTGKCAPRPARQGTSEHHLYARHCSKNVMEVPSYSSKLRVGLSITAHLQILTLEGPCHQGKRTVHIVTLATK